MLRRVSFSCSLALLLLVSGFRYAAADWIENGVPICTAPQNQVAAAIASDPSGNAVVAWLDYRDGYWAVYAQKIDQSGNMLWDLDGVRLGRSICDESAPNGSRVTLLCNEYGETIVTWYGMVSGVTGPCAQMVDAAGKIQWSSDGVVVGPGTMKNTCPSIASDGAGGALIVWSDTRKPDADLFIQRIDRAGNILWNPQGVPVCTAVFDQLRPVITSDLHGGAIVAWQDYRSSGWNFFAQRMSSSGVPLWRSNGLPLCNASWNEPGTCTIVSDGKGGALFAWRSYDNDIYAQRINAGGEVKWGTCGTPVCYELYTQAGPTAVPDGNGGAFITWYDYREYYDFEWDIYAQRIDSVGAVRWEYNGVPVCRELGPQIFPSIRLDHHGGVVITWQDGRGSDMDVYAQRLDGSGHGAWVENGTRLCGAAADQILTYPVCFENGDAIVGWHDYRSGSCDLYAQKILFDGSLGWVVAEPVILAVRDVPKDEGGLVRIKMRASGIDNMMGWGVPITFYNVWRRMDVPFVPSISVNPGPYEAVSPCALFESISKERNSEGLRLSRDFAAELGFPPGAWESIGLHVAKQDSIYYLTVVTLRDSTANDPARETYVVSAHTALPWLYYVSAPDSGCSVDNLAPATPQGFAGRQSSVPPGLRLTWSPSPARDLARYALYRGSSEDFIPAPGNMLLETAEASAFDYGWTPANEYFYKLSAVDRHGNESGPALLRPDEIVATLLQGFSAAVREQCAELVWTVSEIGEGCNFFVLRREGANGAYEELSSQKVIRTGLSFTYRDESCEPGTTYQYRVEYAEASNRRVLFETDDVSIPFLPVTLYQNNPNPFNPSTTIAYYLPVASQVALDVYDSAGRLINRLVDRTADARGMHRIEWNGQDDNGRAVASGVYFYRLQTGKETISKKMVLLR